MLEMTKSPAVKKSSKIYGNINIRFGHKLKWKKVQAIAKVRGITSAKAFEKMLDWFISHGDDSTQ